MCQGEGWIPAPLENAALGEGGFGFFGGGEVDAVGVVEDEGGDAGFGFHHEAFSELDADFFGAKEGEELGLVFEVGAGRVAEAVAFAAVAGGEAFLHGHVGAVGEAPLFAEAAVEPFGGGFGGFDGEGLQGVGFEVIAAIFRFLRVFEDGVAGGDDKHGDVIARGILGIEDVVA